MILCGQSNRVWHYWAGKHPGSVGLLVGPSYLSKVPLDPWMPFALDNDAFKAWRSGEPWNEQAWRDMLSAIRLRRLSPLWAVVPDVVCDREQTIANWRTFSHAVKSLGWPCAFAVQNGMTAADVPEDAGVVFVGGSDGWKFPSLPMWCSSFPRVHCARVTSQEMIERCEELGCESIDGTGWFRAPDRPDHLPMLQRFIEGHRAKHQQMEFKNHGNNDVFTLPSTAIL